MGRDGYVVISTFYQWGQSHVTSRLSCYYVSKTSESAGQVVTT